METAVDTSPVPRVSMMLTATETDTAQTSPVYLDLEETDQDPGPGDMDEYLLWI